jgi:hypothetical protein
MEEQASTAFPGVAAEIKSGLLLIKDPSEHERQIEWQNLQWKGES